MRGLTGMNSTGRLRVSMARPSTESPTPTRLIRTYAATFFRRFIALWRSFEKFGGRCLLQTWIYRIAHNVATSHVIRQRRNNAVAFLTLEEAESQTDHEEVESFADRHQALTHLLALIQRLEPIDRQLMLAYLEGMDAASIAEITGLSAANVWTRIHRIKGLLTRQFHGGVANA
jgi:RNA polymerase sigma-70 factor, ECF subfamily